MAEKITEALGFVEEVESGGMRQVFIRAGTSKNNRQYSPEVLKASVDVFKTIPTFGNHNVRADIFQVTGWLKNARWDEGKQALVADRVVANTPSGQAISALIQDLSKDTEAQGIFGSSVNLYANIMRGENGEPDVVEKIDSYISVDDVVFPAAGGELPAQESLLTYEVWRDMHPEYTDKLRKELKDVRQTGYIKELSAELRTVKESAAGTEAELEKLRARHADAQVGLLLAGSVLPTTWQEKLRPRLLSADECDREAILKEDEEKYRGTEDANRRINPTGISKPSGGGFNGLPQVGEDVAQWRQRTGRK